MTAEDLDRYIDASGDKPVLTADGVALLMGVGVDEFMAEVRKQMGAATFVPPTAWLQRGYQRISEYVAATGRDDEAGAIAYWLARNGEGR